MKEDLLTLGCGVGLRSVHYPEILEKWPVEIEWVEAVSENFMDSSGRPIKILEKVRKHYPVALHGVAMSIGSTDPLNQTYLNKLKALVERIDPIIVSDHICWSGVGGHYLHDLLPLPFDEESLQHIVSRVQQVQEILKRPLVLENVSTYVTYRHSTMPEWEFVNQISKRSGCGLLLDVNNVYVNATNHAFNPYDYMMQVDGSRVRQIHLAGYSDRGKYLFDTHSREVSDEVWKLYRYALETWGRKPTLIEWDEAVPSLADLLGEAEKARRIYQSISVSEPAVPKIHSTNSAAENLILPRDEKKETSLKLLQNRFKEAMHPEFDAVKTDRRVYEFLNPQGGDPGVERLAVYREGYVGRTAEALKEVFEAVHHLMGEAAFQHVAYQYAVAYPSQSYNLGDKGEFLPDFLQTLSYGQKLPFLPDLARMEWRISQAFHAREETPWEASSLAALKPGDWENLVLTFQPSLHLLESVWPVLDLWNLRRTPVQEIKLEIENKPQTIFIARKPGREVFCELMDPSAYAILKGLKEGQPLGEVLENILQSGGQNIPVDQYFARWMQHGLITTGKIIQTGK